MGIRYKFDILQALKEKGYTTYKLRVDKLLNESTMTKIRNNNAKVTVETIDTICTLLECQPGDLLEWVPDQAD